MLVWTSLLLAFTALLPLVNPLGSSLVFLGLVGEAPVEVYKSLARKIALNNIVFLAVIEVLGSAILNFFGLSLPIVQLAGGCVIVGIGWSVLNSTTSGPAPNTGNEARTVDDEEAHARILQEKVFYPFTFPVTSGPGTLVTMLTVSAHFSSGPLSERLLGHAGIFIAVLILSALVYICYAYAPRITKAVPPTTAHGIQRVIAFITLCIGVQIGWNGLQVLLRTVLKH